MDSALNLPFADWGKIFDSTTVATAIADRLVNNSQVLILEGESYTKEIKESLKTICSSYLRQSIFAVQILTIEAQDYASRPKWLVFKR